LRIAARELEVRAHSLRAAATLVAHGHRHHSAIELGPERLRDLLLERRIGPGDAQLHVEKPVIQAAQLDYQTAARDLASAAPVAGHATHGESQQLTVDSSQSTPESFRNLGPDCQL